MAQPANALPPAQRAALSERVGTLGERTVLGMLGVSRAALARALAGLPVRAGTLALIRIGFDQLAETTPKSGVERSAAAPTTAGEPPPSGGRP